MPFLVKRPLGVAAIKKAQEGGGTLVTVAQKDGTEDQPSSEGLYRVGTLARIERMAGSEVDGYQLVMRGIGRFKVSELYEPEAAAEAFSVEGEKLPSGESDEVSEEARRLMAQAKGVGKAILNMIPGNTSEIESLLDQIEDPSLLGNVAAANLNLPVKKAQELLESESVEARLRLVLEELEAARRNLTLQKEVERKMGEKIGKAQREALLREQMKTIQDELGEGDENEVEELRKRIEAAGLPDEVMKLASRELKRFEKIGPQSPESHVIRNWLEWIADMPWKQSTQDQIDLQRSEEVLERDHTGMQKVKQRILQHLAVMKLKKGVRGSILCLVGPPGVGKTSLGQSVAEALGREFVRVSLGGVRDESEIRGHRRTYVGAMPGRLVQGMKRAGTRNPVFLLDEIDKLSQSYHGDPAAALLEVLDPEQNNSFTDHYLDVPFDLSDVFFIATANSLETIPAPLLDRLEVIQLAGYTPAEKLGIAKRHLVSKQVEAHGLEKGQVNFEDCALEKVIAQYTREAGVRSLQRAIGALCRSAAEELVRSGESRTITVDEAWVEKALGPERYESEVSEEISVPGVVTGLAWTPNGGEILFLESQAMPGRGNLILTGQLGEVMKESAQIALSLVRAKLPRVAPQYEYEKRDIHIHVPCGAIPKDGPSAGLAILTSIASLLSGRTLDPKTAMTGEITLRGAVLPVGGIKEKVIAAHRAGITRVILSRKNEKDLRDVPEEVRSSLKVELVSTVDEVLKLALGLETVDLPLGGTRPRSLGQAVA